jgi:uncharacterized protein
VVRFDLPTVDPDTAPFWDAARARRLMIRRCRACARAHLHPRPFCPHCWSEHVVWEDASGLATLYTWSVVHRNDLPPFGDLVPYAPAVVDLAEGPRMMTWVVDCAFSDLRIGMPLEVTFEQRTEALALPVFRPRPHEEPDRARH